MEKDDLLNIKPKKNIKKPLVYGAIAFLIFIIAVIAYAIYSNSKEEKNIVLPPQVNPQPKKSSGFKELPIEDNVTVLSQKLIQNQPNEANNSIKPKNEFKQLVNSKNVPETKTEVLNKTKININKKSKTVTNVTLNGKYYIQVAALMRYKKPNKKFLDLIKREGFNYKIYYTHIIKNGKKIPITKILIGPFENEKIARAKLKIVKEKITQNAFIFKVR